MRSRAASLLCCFFLLGLFAPLAFAQATGKPKLTLDEFFDSVHYSDIKLSPDGNALLIGTERADWKRERYRKDIWLWRADTPGPTLLTQSAKDWNPEWSPDGKWIAFLSDRTPESPLPEDEADVPKEPEIQAPPPGRRRRDDSNSDEQPESKKSVSHLYLLSTSGGEAFAVTQGLEEVHAFAWAPDSQFLYFTTRRPWSKAKRDAYKKEWKDVIRFRESERGDVIARISLSDAIVGRASMGSVESKPVQKNEETAETPGSLSIARVKHRVSELRVSPDGRSLAYMTDSVSQRVEGVESYEIYITPTAGGTPQPITHNEAIEADLRWTPDGRSILFTVRSGSAEGKYEDVQNRVYSVDVASHQIRRWASDFPGSITEWAISPTGALVSGGRTGTEVQLYTQLAADAPLTRHPGWPGTYERVTTAAHSLRVAFVYSAVDRPTEVYVAESVDRLQQAVPVTSLNKVFAGRALPQGHPYTWKASDGTQIEGELIYPPGKFGARNLKMLTLIHGGPADADGNKFGADWYDWAILAASDGWLVFRPNYRGSSGYGDKFMRDIVPRIVSLPGTDILEGVDALAKAGIANPDQLAIGGYSYGGYMTNWLITQTTRFKAAVSGAGAVEHAANWGNDDLTFDDAYYLGGYPWKVPNNYSTEAALFHFDKVKTPTHVVCGADDVRVAAAENYLLERALNAIHVPSSLLVFPGEGHLLEKNPWHGKIKVREELKWLDRYTSSPAGAQGKAGQ